VIAVADLRDQPGLVHVATRVQQELTRPGRTERDAPHPDKPILGVADAALAAWLEMSQLSEGPLFRRLRKTTHGPGLSRETVIEIVRRCARQAVCAVTSLTTA